MDEVLVGGEIRAGAVDAEGADPDGGRPSQ